MKEVFLVNPPDKDIEKMHISKDMAGGFGFNAGKEVLLPPLELIYHALTLKKAGYKIEFYDFQVEAEKIEEFYKKIKKTKECKVIVLVTTPTLESDLKLIKKIKSLNKKASIFVRFDIKNEEIIKKILKTKLVKAVLAGETELIIKNILEGKIRKKIIYEKVQNLNDLPDLELDFVNIEKYQYPLLPNKNGNTFTFQSSRGCPFPCAYYCPYPLIQGNIWRAMSEEKLFRNIKILIKKYNVKSILFRDATFTLDKKRIEKFCENIIKNKLKFSWWCETRMNCLDKNLLQKMAKAGCKGINLGVETGDDELMKKQGKIGGDIKQLKNISQLSKNFGIKLHFLMIVGLPEETKKSIYKSYLIIEKLKPESLGVTTITPYPGTELYKDAVKNKWIVDKKWQNYVGNAVVMRSKYLSPKQIRLGNFLLRVAGYINKQKSPIYKVFNFIFKIFFIVWSKI